MKSITQHKTLIYEFKIRKVKSTRRKIWKLHEDSLKSNFSSCINQYRATSQKDTSVEDYWNVLKEATDRSCVWTKVQLHIKKHGGGVMMLVIVLLRSGSACNEKYLDSRKKASRTVTSPNVMQKGKDKETLCSEISRNAMCLKVVSATFLLVYF